MLPWLHPPLLKFLGQQMQARLLKLRTQILKAGFAEVCGSSPRLRVSRAQNGLCLSKCNMCYLNRWKEYIYMYRKMEKTELL
jgi:hypothetical protein